MRGRITPLKAHRTTALGSLGSIWFSASRAAAKPCATAGSPRTASPKSPRTASLALLCSVAWTHRIESEAGAEAVHRVLRSASCRCTLFSCPASMGFALFGVPISPKESGRNFQRVVEVGLFNAGFLRSSCQAHALVDQRSCRFARILQGLGKLVAEHDLLHALLRTRETGCEMIVLRGWRKVGNSINLRPVLLRNFDCSIISRVQHVDGTLLPAPLDFTAQHVVWGIEAPPRTLPTVIVAAPEFPEPWPRQDPQPSDPDWPTGVPRCRIRRLAAPRGTSPSAAHSQISDVRAVGSF